MVFYGKRVAEEFKRAGKKAKRVWVKKTLSDFARKLFPEADLRVVPQKIIEKVSGSQEHQGIAFEPREKVGYYDFFKLMRSRKNLRILVFLDGVQDVGNIGNIIRTAEFFGCDFVVVSDESSPYITPALVKASAGSFFHIPVSRVRRRDFFSVMKHKGVKVYTLDVKGERNIFDFEFEFPCAICLGSEGKGVSTEILSSSDEVLKIPGGGKVSSLNVSSAFAVSVAFAFSQLHKSGKGVY